MRILVYPLLAPLFAFALVQVALKATGQPGLEYQGFLPVALILAYLGGAIPALAIGKLLDMLKLHAVRPNAALVLALLLAGAAVAALARQLELYAMILPPLVLCWLIVSRLNARGGT